MYFQKKSKVAVLLVFLLLVAGLLLFTRNSGGITGAAITLAEESSDLLIQPIVESELEEIADEEVGVQPIEEEQTAESEDPPVEVVIPQAEKFSTKAVIEPQAGIDSCQILFDGTYTLVQNVSATESCFHINGNSITLDCTGFRITYASASDGTAINNTGGFDHITIKNCDIIESTGRTNTPAITFRGVTNSTIEYNKIVTKGTFAPAIILEDSDNNTIRSNNISTTVALGVRLSVGILFNESAQVAAALHEVSTGNMIINNNFSIFNYSLYFHNYTLNDLLLANNTLAYNNSLGAINWTNINLTTSANLSVALEPGGSNGSIFLANNVTGIADLNITTGDRVFNINTSARIEIKNLSYRKTPGLFKRGVRCDNSSDATFRCNISGYDSGIGILYANVTSFSNYSTTFVNIIPLISPVILNTTNISLNDTNVNLTAYANFSDNDTGDSVKVIYNFLVNNSPIALLNMPFEGVNGTNVSNAVDYSGLANNGSIYGASWNATAGYDGKGAYMFDGVNDAINITNKDYFNLSGRAFSVTAWVKANETSISGAIMAKVIPGGGNGFRLEFNTGLPSFLVAGTPSLSSNAQNESTGWNDNIFHHYAGTFNGSEARLYIDGVLRANGGNAVGGDNTDNDQYILIGKRSKNSAFFNGTIDDVMFLNRSLSPEQVFALYQNKTNIIVAQETTRGENWTVQATPNDGYEDGTRNQSGNVTILNIKPVISPLVLNTTNISRNDTNVNLTAYAN